MRVNTAISGIHHLIPANHQLARDGFFPRSLLLQLRKPINLNQIAVFVKQMPVLQANLEMSIEPASGEDPNPGFLAKCRHLGTNRYQCVRLFRSEELIFVCLALFCCRWQLCALERQPKRSRQFSECIRHHERGIKRCSDRRKKQEGKAA